MKNYQRRVSFMHGFGDDVRIGGADVIRTFNYLLYRGVMGSDVGPLF